MPESREISQAKRKRNSKKYMITKTIEEISSLILTRGSRTKVKYLRTALDDMHHQAVILHEDLMLLLENDNPDYNDIWIDDLSLRINSCCGDVTTYLKERENDTLSSSSSEKVKERVQMWREETATQIQEEEKSLTDDKPQSLPDDITAAFSQLHVTENLTETTNRRHYADVKKSSDVKHIGRKSSSLSDLPHLANSQETAPFLDNYPKLQRGNQPNSSLPSPLRRPNVYEDGLDPTSESRLYLQEPIQTTRDQLKSRLSSGEFTNQDLYQSYGNSRTQRQVTFQENLRTDAPLNSPIIEGDPLHSTYIIQDKRQPSVKIKSTRERDKETERVSPEDKDESSSTQAVDAWIDDLNRSTINIIPDGRIHDVQMQMLIQQRLPPQRLPTFDGAADKWVLFISNFFDMVHNQPYLDIFQKRTYLNQHLVGEPKKAIEGFASDTDGYIASLKRLKYMFGNPSLVAQATIRKVVTGNQIPEHDSRSLTQFYYALSTCINTLVKMKYTADIHSTDVLRQILKRLPNHLLRKWSEYSLILRQKAEPNLIHLEQWLQARVMASKDPNLPTDRSNRNGPRVHKFGPTDNTRHCPCCNGDHYLFKCEGFKAKPDDEKLNFVKSKRLCFNCLGQGHGVSTCSSKKTCFAKGCKKHHHTTIHQAIVNLESKAKPEFSKDKDRKDGPKLPSINMTRNDYNVFLKVVPVTVTNQAGHSVNTYALLDSGSQCTLITKSLCQSLKLPGKVKKVSFGTIKDEEEMQAKIVNLKLSSTDGSFVSQVKNVYSLHEDNFKVPGQTVPVTDDPKWDYIRDIDLPQVESRQVQVLIGADVPAALLTKEVRKGASGLPYATKTPLGWTLFGLYEGGASGSIWIKHIRPRVHKEENRLDDLVKQFWDTESFGTEFDMQEPMSVTDKKFLKVLEDETTFEDGHYVVPMLWKSDKKLPDSSPMASRRLSYLTKRFQRDQDYFTKYKENVDGYLNHNYARKLTKEESKEKLTKSWYLPHHGVINENKPGKVRMVFDAASKTKNQSLNSSLSTGPDLLNSLLGVLLRFRKHKIAIVADIEKMFYQVRLKPEDTDSLRFLWHDDPHSKEEPDQYKMLVHILGATCSPCCASYALRRAITDQKGNFPSDVINTLLRNFYVDDLLSSVTNEDKGKELIKSSDILMGNRGFNLTKYNSNSKEVLQAAPEHKRASNTSIEFENTITRALGVKWDLKEDCFLYNVNVDPIPTTLTKRLILKKASTVFDPLGFLAPFTLKAKLILQDLWRLKVNWDEPLDVKTNEVWSQWLKELSQLSKSIRIPRSLDLILESSQLVQLHVFCDASERAFAAAAYIRVEECGAVRVHIIMAKTRVAPIKQISLPRLELQGAVMAVRIKETINKEFDHDFEQTIFWTDSTLNLQCINNEERRFRTFVANRISEIREHSEVSQWKFVPGKTNPSDLATREEGLKAVEDDVWLNGPAYLRLPESEWPSIPKIPLDENYIELRRVNVTQMNVTKPLLQYERFSSWRKIVRVIAWIHIFFKNFKASRKSSSKSKQLTSTQRLEIISSSPTYQPTLQQEESSEHQLVKLIQNESFPDVMKQIQEGRQLKGSLKKLDVFLDDQGVMRVGGRLKYGDFPYASKHQIVLPAKQPAVILLGRKFHNQFHHVGKEHMLSLLRQRYWIIGGRAMCRQIIQSCITCQKLNAKPSFTKMANLPEDRITVSTPTFYHTGVDYFGPILVKVLRSRVKRWGCIFTCLTTRAIHLEVAPSLESDDFINVLERFICRRGSPKLIRSDCGTNFKGANNELKKELERMDSAKIDQSLRRQSIEWDFNPPESPHMGGVWERMVRSVKTSLNAVIMAEYVVLNDFTLLTVLTEVEALVNSRPLTSVSDDTSDLDALTPNHFIIGRASTLLPTCITYNDNVTPRKRWKQVQSTTQQFWDRWRREYLPTLTARNKWTRASKNVQVGDLVLVHDTQSLSRGKWLLGRINQVFPGRDNRVRKVEVITHSGRYTRPITMISPLELSN
ncbi:uncharacterized protein [Clytia hemisphaerica]|uniref:uncharacterized protein n=1 Tax=Clytia hemisphaerica TaxID=252671 RepID=UPI0034D6A9FE